MKLVDSSIISEPAEFICNLLNVVVTRHYFVIPYETVKFIPNTLYVLTNRDIYAYFNSQQAHVDAPVEKDNKTCFLSDI